MVPANESSMFGRKRSCEESPASIESLEGVESHFRRHFLTASLVKRWLKQDSNFESQHSVRQSTRSRLYRTSQCKVDRDSLKGEN